MQTLFVSVGVPTIVFVISGDVYGDGVLWSVTSKNDLLQLR